MRLYTIDFHLLRKRIEHRLRYFFRDENFVRKITDAVVDEISENIESNNPEAQCERMNKYDEKIIADIDKANGISEEDD